MLYPYLSLFSGEPCKDPPKNFDPQLVGHGARFISCWVHEILCAECMIFPRWLCDKRRCWCSSKNGGGMETHNRVCITERAMRIWFWIYYHCETGEITCGDLIEGDVITGGPGTHGSISFVNSDMTNETCAFFHTHTPVRYCGYGASRITGDSEADRKHRSRRSWYSFGEQYAAVYKQRAQWQIRWWMWRPDRE